MGVVGAREDLREVESMMNFAIGNSGLVFIIYSFLLVAVSALSTRLLFPANARRWEVVVMFVVATLSLVFVLVLGLK